MEVVPLATPVIVAAPLAILTVAIFVFPDVAAYGTVPPLTDTDADLPTRTLTLLWLTAKDGVTVTVIAA